MRRCATAAAALSVTLILSVAAEGSIRWNAKSVVDTVDSYFFFDDDKKKKSPTPSPTPCPVPIICLNDTFSPGANDTMSGRIQRNAEPSNCTNDKMYPGTLNNGNNFYYQLGPYGGEAVDTCVVVNWNVGDCTSVHPTTYSSFDPTNQQTGYLADSGTFGIEEFSFNLAAGEFFVMVLQQLQPNTDPTGCAFGFCIDFGLCP